MAEAYELWKAMSVAGEDITFWQNIYVKFYQAFIEADRSTSKRYQPELEYYDEEMAEFEQLITSVWSYITSLDLPDISEYNKDYHGIVDFEKWLCANPNPHLIQ